MENNLGDLLHGCMAWTVLQRTDKMSQRKKRNNWLIMHWSTHPQGEQKEAEKMLPWRGSTTKCCILFGYVSNNNTYTFWQCSWCNGYRHRKWTRRLEFKSWTRLIAFHIALIPLGKVWIHLFSLQLWVNSRTDRVLQENSEFKPVKLRLKIDLVSYPVRAEGLVNRIIHIHIQLQYICWRILSFRILTVC